MSLESRKMIRNNEIHTKIRRGVRAFKALTLFVMMIPKSALSQDNTELDSLAVFTELVGTVTDLKADNPKPSLYDSAKDSVLNLVWFPHSGSQFPPGKENEMGTYKEIPEDLLELVCDYYSDGSVPLGNPSGVLSYLTGIYSEHGYHDSGNWAKKTHDRTVYIPYSGNLPEYTETDFQMPVEGRLTSIYGYRPKFGRFHRGVDLALNTGDTVKCALPGVVTRTGYETGGYGRYVVVVHSGGVETLYGHLSCSLVTPGQNMKAGDAIGLGGITGNATGPHLHFETRYRGVAIDPLSWFNLTVP